jgi:hypothetical protein
MKANVLKTLTVRLDMTGEEARWLMGCMQNPLYNQSPTKEAETDSITRNSIFHCLKAALEESYAL